MAIVFVSPKKRQRIFIAAIATAMVFILVVIVFLVFLPEITKKLKDIPDNGALNVSEIKINFDIADSDTVADMKLISAIDREFFYTAKDKQNKEITGTISAANESAAKKLLGERGFANAIISELKVGRNNPFAPQ